jgi:prepilin-type N-terminal cleavage/methylation domain-containing protein
MQSFIENKSKMHAMNTKPSINNIRGFTLVELMVVVLLTAIAVIAIYRGYTAFSHSADAQEQIIEMQQNLRIGMYTMVKDIMRAGMTEEDDYIILVDAVRRDMKTVTFFAADASTVEFGMDLGSGGVFATDGIDNDGDGVEDDDPDPAVAAIEAQEEGRMGDGDLNDDGERIRYTLNGEDLQRQVWDSATSDYGPAQTIITNVSALGLTYVKDDDTVLGALPLNEGDRSLIDTVEITMVVRTTNEDLRITNNETYGNNLRGTTVLTVSPPDHFRRRAMTRRVKIRNANLL